MGDILKYRIPGHNPITEIGSFIELDSYDEFEGFIVSTFSKNKRFGFVHSDELPEFHFSSIKPEPVSAEAYELNASLYIDQFKSGVLSKAILSRTIQVKQQVDPVSFFYKLCDNYPEAFIYLVSASEFGTWIGATPEILFSRKENDAFTMALAGTRTSTEGSSWTAKEREEQKYVSDFIESVLTSSNIREMTISGPKIVKAGPVEHIRTDFHFELDPVHDARVIEKLHPTPAVCGMPTEKALGLIQKTEGYDRSLYSGMIGRIGEQSEVYVNLRCAQLFEDECYLYVGGGLTIESDPKKEWEETENKAKTLLNIIEKL